MGGEPHYVAVSGHFALVASWQDGLRVVDVSDPSTATEVGSLDGIYATVVAGIGGYAYVLSGNRFLVVELGDGSTPQIRGSVNIGTSGGIAVAGGTAYVAQGSGMVSIDVTDPSMPRILDRLVIPAGASSIAVRSGLAFVASGSGGLRVVDISNPEHLIELSTLDVPGEAWDIAVDGEFAFIASGLEGLQVVDVSVPDYPYYPYESFAGAPRAYRIGRNTDHVYISGSDDITVYDVEDPDNPVQVSNTEAEPHGSWMNAVIGDFVYYTARDSTEITLRVLDFSDSASPIEVARLLAPSIIQDFEVVGTTAYAAYATRLDRPPYFDSGLWILDISNPAAPVEVGTYAPDGFVAREITISGQHAYVADGIHSNTAGVTILDISFPQSPVEIGRFATPDAASQVVLFGGYAFVGDNVQGATNRPYRSVLRVFDLEGSDPPEQIAELTTEFQFTDLERAGSVLVATLRHPVYNTRANAAVFDIRTPEAPRELGRVTTIGGYAFELVEGRVYVAGASKGLRVIDFGPEYPIARPVSVDILPERETNAINLLTAGLIQVAILGSGSFDVNSVDRDTLRFGRGQAIPVQHRKGYTRDVNRDGYTDLVSGYQTQDSGIAFQDVEACVTGATLEGVHFEGCDSVEVRSNSVVARPESTAYFRPVALDSNSS
jgi:hypothetical protein